ncbi:MAG: ROK family protein [Cyclobacteriaceae bacterium]
MNVLVIDIGGTNVKILATGQTTPLKFASGKKMTPDLMIAQIKSLTKKWKYEAVSIGYPGFVKNGKIQIEPHNLASGWVGFDFKKAFGLPVKIMNDAAMQALGSYKTGSLLFLGLGTGLGSTFIVDGMVIPFEVSQLSYKKGTFADYIGNHGLKRYGKKKWRGHVKVIIERLSAAIHPDQIVIGGGNCRHLNKLPPLCCLGDNKFAFAGGFRMWEASEKPLKNKTEKNRSA